MIRIRNVRSPSAHDNRVARAQGSYDHSYSKKTGATSRQAAVAAVWEASYGGSSLQCQTVSVVVCIVSYNTCAMLRRCLSSAMPQLNAVQGAVVVVDNASSDGSPEMVRRCFPQAKLIALSENIGFGRANNLGVASIGDAKYVLLLNSDTELPPDGLRSLLTFAEAHPDAGVIAPQLHNAAGMVERSCSRCPRLSLRLFEALGLHKVFRGRGLEYHPWPFVTASRVEQATAACLLVRRSAWECVGGFDEAFFMYYEDTDLCRRWRQHGISILFWPGLAVLHHGGASADKAAERVAHHLHGQTVAYGRWYGRGGAVIVQLFEAMYTILYSLQLLPAAWFRADAPARARLHVNLATLRWLLTGRWFRTACLLSPGWDAPATRFAAPSLAPHASGLRGGEDHER